MIFGEINIILHLLLVDDFFFFRVSQLLKTLAPMLKWAIAYELMLVINILNYSS